jgi:hypothetical protein
MRPQPSVVATSSMKRVDGAVGGETGDALELVEGAAGVAEAAAADHGHAHAAGGHEGGEGQADLVADAAGAVFVDLAAGHVEKSRTSPERSMPSAQGPSSSGVMPRK